MIGCGASRSGAGFSNIERGQVEPTQSAPHDELLKAVLVAHGEAKKAPNDEQAVRAALAGALDLDPTTDTAAIILAAGSRAKKLRTAGMLLHLRIAPQLTLITQRSGGSIAPTDDAFIKAAEQAAKASLELSRRLAELEDRANDLERRRTELASQPESRKGSLERELAGAKVVLAEAQELSGKHSGRMARFLIDLAGAVETGAAGAGAKPVAAAPAKPVAASRPKKPVGKPSGPAAAPPKRPPSDDFEP